MEPIFCKSKKIRRLITQKINEIFNDYDALIFPTTGTAAPTIKGAINDKSDVSEINDLSDNILLLANFSGIPSITIPMGFVDDLPVGLNINTQFNSDDLCLKISYHLQESLEIEKRNLEEVINNE